MVHSTADSRSDDGILRLAPVLALSLVVYVALWPAVTGGMRHFLVPWLDTILARGKIGAFSAPFSNYTPPYLYLLTAVSPLAVFVPKISLIKALSIAATLLLALAVRQVVRWSGSDRSGEAAAWLFLIPTVAINAAGMGQCDALWSAAAVMAVACAIERRSTAMLVWFGIAIAFKAQAVFLGPFIAQRLVVHRAPLRLWLIPPLVYALAMLPAALAGWPIADLLTIYLRQAGWNRASSAMPQTPGASSRL